MILQALVDYYEKLVQKEKLPTAGWGDVKVSYALEIEEDGSLTAVLPLKQPDATGKKMVPRVMKVPAPHKRTVGITANFLCDNSAYLLGFDGKGNPKRAAECFEAAKELHQKLLGASEDEGAKALCRYFENWNPETARDNELFAEAMADLEKGANLVFLYQDEYLQKNPQIAKAWQDSYSEEGNAAENAMCSLVDGIAAEPAAIHPAIQGVRGAQSSGAALISFNSPAACSYEREQNFNAPMSKYSAFAYTTALNYLLSQRDGSGRPKFSKLVGDTTVVFWAEDAEEVYQDVFSAELEGDSSILEQEDLRGFVDKICGGEPIDWSSLPVKAENRFYILGLAPNAARLSVRFFLRDTFGNFAQHLEEHYKRLQIIKPSYEKFEVIPLYWLLKETVMGDQDVSPQMAGSTMRAIFDGGRYPATLYQQVMLRINAERDISYRKAAILKAYLMRNTEDKKYREGLTVKLNEETNYQPYVLGRLFAVLENIQESASGVTTIKDKYFISAAATPAVIFPLVMSLGEKHLRKMEKGSSIYFSKQVTELTSKIVESYPVHMNLYEQGIFQLGYYHQKQKRFEKKDEEK